MAMRRSASEPISQTARARISAAKATAAVEIAADSASFVSAKIRGLSENAIASVPSVARGLPQQSSTAP